VFVPDRQANFIIISNFLAGPQENYRPCIHRAPWRESAGKQWCLKSEPLRLPSARPACLTWPWTRFPGTSVGIGEMQVSILVTTADASFHDLGAVGGGNDFIQPEDNHHEDPDERNGLEKVPQAGLQKGNVHGELQSQALLECFLFTLWSYRPELENNHKPG
jgi:hypothetical protein